MWRKTEDGSIVDASGKVIYFSNARFVRDICLGACCFICGAAPGSKPFNDEHVLPEWLLRHFDLFSKTITLPNGVHVRYDSYTIPCCCDCNALMGEVVEGPISKVVKGGLQAINDFAVNGDLLKLFVWAGLIYLKTHLKDRLLRFHLDARKGEEKIADDYDWSDLHHLHCVVRCFYNNCTVEQPAVGSFLTMPVNQDGPVERFDFADLYLAQTMLLRLDDAAIFCVFNDSGAALNAYWQILEEITGKVSPIQCREIMTELALANLRLVTRPLFQTECDMGREECRILATRPEELEFAPLDMAWRGQLLKRALQDVPEGMQFVGKTREEALAEIEAGRMSFLFDDDGKFITQSTVPDPKAEAR